MSQEQSVVVSPAAHTKMILHACRNPHSQVHGVLVGSFDKQATGGPVLQLVDAIPVFHSSPTKPILDMALRLIEAHIDGSSGAVDVGIMGWYSANERLGDDARPGQAALRIVGGLATGFEAMGKSIPTHAELVTILVSSKDTVELLKDDGGNSGAAGLMVFGRDTRKHWLRPYAPANVKCTSSKAARAACLEGTERMPIFDFEDHLDGEPEHLATRDWLTNTVVSGFVQRSE